MEKQSGTKSRLIITGVTGMVGEGVLHECLQHPSISEVLVINRKPCGVVHPKLKELIHKDFFNLEPIEKDMAGYDACLFCLGVSSLGMKEAEYFRLTYTLTMHVAETLARQNSRMTFCYISGAHTDSTEHGKLMWARVKGKTENDLLKLPFKAVYNFRPGILNPTKGLKNTLGFYKWLGWLLPVIKMVFPGSICSLRDLGVAMIAAATNGYEKQTIEVSDIQVLAKLH
ncbi:MAG: NAD-dependent epimerase/dehydratase family protein [Chitinophagaceae bacterium]